MESFDKWQSKTVRFDRVALAILAIAIASRGAIAADCGVEPVCGGTVNHICHCGDNVKWNYTLSGTLTNGDGSSPCNTTVELTIGNGVTLTGDGTGLIQGPGSTPGTVGIQFNGTTGATVTSSTGFTTRRARARQPGWRA